MDPLVDAFHQISPSDHSLDGLPFTVFLVGGAVLVSTTLALRFTGRSWRTWHIPALCVLFAWWAGVNVGRSGFGSAGGLMWTFGLIAILIDPVWRTVRAALVPAKRDGRR